MTSKWNYFLLLLCWTFTSFAGEIYGVFKRSSDQNSYYFLASMGRTYGVKTISEALLTSISTLEQREAMVALQDSAFIQETVLVSEAPFLNKAQFKKNGLFEKGGLGQYVIDGEAVGFEKAKIINGHQFDDISRSHFLGKKVVTRGNRVNGIYTIASIMEDDLFSATKNPGIVGTPAAVALHTPFLANPSSYVLKTMPQHKISSSSTSFRATVFDEGKAVHPGEEVMILTMSGHQGDEPWAVNGHIAAGLGQVQADMSIDGEIYNVYIPPFNKKEIVSGSQRLIDYFGHLIGGQNNYRPTFSMIIYGIDPEKIRRVRESLELYHSHFRVTDKQMSVAINCGTLTVKALASEGIYGFIRNHKNGTAKFPLLPIEYKRPAKMGIGKQLMYLFKTPMEEYLPRRIWDSYFKNIQFLNDNEKLGIHRVDFVFYGQTPSSRPRGGIAGNELTDDLKGIFFRKNGLSKID